MRDLTISVILRSVWATPLLMAFLHQATVCQPARGADDVTVEQIGAAWERRRGSIKSFQYDCELEKFLVKGSLNNIVEPSNKPPGEDIPNKDFILRGAITFSLSGDRIAYSYEGEQWDEISSSPQIREFRATFDGVHNKTLFGGGPQAQGLVDSGGKPTDALTAHVNLTALWLAFSPVALLEQLGYSPGKMTVSELDVFRDGDNCVELSIPRGNPAWRALVYVDPSRDYVPLQFITEKDDVVARDLSIQYVRDEQVGWRVLAWDDKQFDKSGTLETSLSGKVNRLSINQPLGDEVFTLGFPEGTHVVEREGDTDKYYVALGDGKKREISRREFGALPPEVPEGRSWIRFILAGVGLGVIVALVFLLRWRRETR